MKPRILFVDDEPKFLRGVRRLLDAQKAVWDIRYVSDVDAAFQSARDDRIDIIVSDVNMPSKDGFELLQILRNSEQTKDIPVIMVTGAGEPTLKRRALELGAHDLLSKPVNREDLLARLSSALRLKSYQDELKAQNELLEQKVQERTRELANSRQEVIWCLAKAAEYRDDATGHHVARVAYFCRAIAQNLGMDRDFVEMLFLTSPLHDIGKIGTPDHILLKPGKLTPEELEIMRQHCVIGANILRRGSRTLQAALSWGEPLLPPEPAEDNPILQVASSIALNHHEWWDGTGYPRRIAGEDIPLEARIVALSDVYDALGSARPYKPAFSESKVLSIIREEAGRHFDPRVYEAFEGSLDELQEIRKQFSDHDDSVRHSNRPCSAGLEKGISLETIADVSSMNQSSKPR